jgi:hypothetical protein
VDAVEEYARKYEEIVASLVGWLTENLHSHASREMGHWSEQFY